MQLNEEYKQIINKMNSKTNENIIFFFKRTIKKTLMFFKIRIQLFLGYNLGYNSLGYNAFENNGS